MALDGEQIRDDLFRKLGLENPDNAPAYIRADASIAMSWAYQRIWSAPWDFFRKVQNNFNTVGGTQAYTLPQNVAEIVGPVRLNSNTHLNPITRRSDFDHYGTRFEGSTSLISGSGTPAAYHLWRTNQAASDNVKIEMLLTPTPNDAFTILYDAATEAPTVSKEDLCADPGITIEIPHGYVESIFLPLARLGITRSHYFSSMDKLPLFQADAALALRDLKYADPQIKEILGETSKTEGSQE